MTDGIIQKIFRRYLIPEYLPDAILTIEGLQQELIEEIKKSIPYNYDDILEKLIGDNQE